MKADKLFTTIFDEELKSRGFKRKGKLYYKLNGNILQGVIIKTINPYTIHFYAAPYWMENTQIKLSALHKGYWAEQGWCISPGSESFYREENEQLNNDYMTACFSIAKKYILPVLDKICDLDSYIEYCVPNWNFDYDQENEKDVIKIFPKEFGSKYSYLGRPITMLWRVWDELYSYSAFLQYGLRGNNLQNGFDLLDKQASKLPFHTNRERNAQNRYVQYMTDDGLERAERYFEERRAIMIPRLRDELGLDTSSL